MVSSHHLSAVSSCSEVSYHEVVLNVEPTGFPNGSQGGLFGIFVSLPVIPSFSLLAKQ